ncbi:hypothetical protein LIER_31158 [Lithospermum erythrorhizon]|uniref:Uncharacterized protein n=1 Tax=Lithospermum erythrorhizon TaxID=34254 RepID=A0AAV3RS33_LITER
MSGMDPDVALHRLHVDPPVSSNQTAEKNIHRSEESGDKRRSRQFGESWSHSRITISELDNKRRVGQEAK